MHGFLLLFMQPNTPISDKAALHVLCLNASRMPRLVLPNLFCIWRLHKVNLTAPPRNSRSGWYFPLLCTKLRQLQLQKNQIKPLHLPWENVKSHLLPFESLFLRSGSQQLSASPSQWSSPYGIFTSWANYNLTAHERQRLLVKRREAWGPILPQIKRLVV